MVFECIGINRMAAYPNGVIIFTGTTSGFRVHGISLNADWAINQHLLWRVEIKHLQSRDLIFSKQTNFSTQNLYVANTPLSVSF